MPKRTILLFLSLLFILNSCTRNIPIDSQKTGIKSGVDDIPQKEIVPATQKGIDTPQPDTEEITEPTKNPEQMLNDILKELDELEQLMDGTYSN